MSETSIFECAYLKQKNPTTSPLLTKDDVRVETMPLGSINEMPKNVIYMTACLEGRLVMIARVSRAYAANDPNSGTRGVGAECGHVARITYPKSGAERGGSVYIGIPNGTKLFDAATGSMVTLPEPIMHKAQQVYVNPKTAKRQDRRAAKRGLSAEG